MPPSTTLRLSAGVVGEFDDLAYFAIEIEYRAIGGLQHDQSVALADAPERIDDRLG
jgi:hypothetical protein